MCESARACTCRVSVYVYACVCVRAKVCVKNEFFYYGISLVLQECSVQLYYKTILLHF